MFKAIYWRHHSLRVDTFTTFDDAMEVLEQGESDGLLSAVGILEDTTFYLINPIYTNQEVIRCFNDLNMPQPERISTDPQLWDSER